MNIMVIIINTISICYVMLGNKPLFSYFYLNKNNNQYTSSIMDYREFFIIGSPNRSYYLDE